MRQLAKLLAVLCVCATTVLGLSSTANAAPADPTTAVTSVRVAAAETPAPDVAAAVSGSRCGATTGWGKIIYQPCFRYTCTSLCVTQGYLGLINTATGPRTVTWDLDVKSPWTEEHDSGGTYTLAAGTQQTIYSPWEYHHPGCGFQFTEYLKVQYDSAGFSPRVPATATIPCG